MVFYIILRNLNGDYYTLYLYWNDGGWHWDCHWIENDWGANNPSAVLANLFISPLIFKISEILDPNREEASFQQTHAQNGREIAAEYLAMTDRLLHFIRNGKKINFCC